jgi:maleate isomerase
MSTRREFLAGVSAGLAAGVVGCTGTREGGGSLARPTAAAATSHTIVGGLSGNRLRIPNVNAAPMPAIAPPGVIHNGQAIGSFRIDQTRGYPDVRSFRRKFGLLVPVTNTSMEHELWSIIFANQHALDGVGLHTANVSTPRPQLDTESDLLAYKRQFVGGLKAAVEQALLAQPQYLIMGMSLEHILRGIDEIRALMADAESWSGISWATWHDAAPAALNKFGAKRIGLLTPFDRVGNENAAQMFRDLGFDVVASLGFACANAVHIAHVPDAAKERAIVEVLATRENRLDAIVQCGTNMSLAQVSESLEPAIGIPILGINAVTFWYALRENGFDASLRGAGRLLREF